MSEEAEDEAMPPLGHEAPEEEKPSEVVPAAVVDADAEVAAPESDIAPAPVTDDAAEVDQTLTTVSASTSAPTPAAASEDATDLAQTSQSEPEPVPEPEPESEPESPAVDSGLPEGEPMRVRLPIFEGPLDLLLYLIKKEELDIYDVAIERVTRQYLDYIRAMKEMDLEIAGEFLVVASTLVYIKSRNLLPKDVQPPEDDAEEDDPRWELVRQLVEYKKFKDAAFQLQLRHTAQEKAYERILTTSADDTQAPSPAMTMLIGDAGIYDLINAFQKVLARAQSRNQLAEIREDRWTVSDKIRYIDDLLETRHSMAFEELFAEDASRTEMVVTFLALLELVRLKRLRVLQDYSFAGIIIERRTGVTGPIPSGPSGFEE